MNLLVGLLAGSLSTPADWTAEERFSCLALRCLSTSDNVTRRNTEERFESDKCHPFAIRSGSLNQPKTSLGMLNDLARGLC